ncbi:MAG: DNA repair protein RadC [Woeseiaceae bacterium]|nr:DNA repair protein RadC [Woeseiaceae bacterium]
MTTSNATRADNRFANLKVSTLDDAERASLIRLAMKILAARHQRGRAIRSPADTESYLKLRLAEEKAEHFGCVFLDNRHRVLALEHLFHGTIDGTSVYPRVVVQKALEINAAAVILFHNHPSGVAEPSQADERITHRLKSALELIDVRVLDHIIVTAGNCTSLAARGLL